MLGLHDRLPSLLGRLRSERDPYLGLADASRRVIVEEGVTALYRGWWITMLNNLAMLSVV